MLWYTASRTATRCARDTEGCTYSYVCKKNTYVALSVVHTTVPYVSLEQSFFRFIFGDSYVHVFGTLSKNIFRVDRPYKVLREFYLRVGTPGRRLVPEPLSLSIWNLPCERAERRPPARTSARASPVQPTPPTSPSFFRVFFKMSCPIAGRTVQNGYIKGSSDMFVACPIDRTCHSNLSCHFVHRT